MQNLPVHADDAGQPTGDEQINALEAYALLAATQAAVDEVPSYIETRALETWIENSLDEQ